LQDSSWKLAGLLVLALTAVARLSTSQPVAVAQPIADGKDKTPVAKDTAVLELAVPAGAKVTIDGKDVGAQRSFEYLGLEAGKRYEREVCVEFKGREARHTVFLYGGWHVRLPVTAPGEARPELAVQTGVFPRVMSVAFSPDGRQILIGCWDGTALLWDGGSGRKLRAFQGHTDAVRSVAFSPYGKQILTGSYDKTAVLWDAATGQKLRAFQGGHTQSVTSVAFGPDGKQILTGSWDGTAVLWDASTGKKLRTFQGPSDREVINVDFLGVSSVAVSPDAQAGPHRLL
jgi:hypothetical protein